MKLRIRNNSVRLRLTQTEVRRLAAGESVIQTTQFSMTSRLISSIEGSTKVSAPTANFADYRITVLVPVKILQQWAESEEVSILAEQTIGLDRSLQLLIEKDFECLHSLKENDADAFPNPLR